MSMSHAETRRMRAALNVAKVEGYLEGLSKTLNSGAAGPPEIDLQLLSEDFDDMAERLKTARLELCPEEVR